MRCALPTLTGPICSSSWGSVGGTSCTVTAAEASGRAAAVGADVAGRGRTVRLKTSSARRCSRSAAGDMCVSTTISAVAAGCWETQSGPRAPPCPPPKRTSMVRVGRRRVWWMLSQYLGVGSRSSFFSVTIIGPSLCACTPAAGGLRAGGSGGRRCRRASWRRAAAKMAGAVCSPSTSRIAISSSIPARSPARGSCRAGPDESSAAAAAGRSPAGQRCC